LSEIILHHYPTSPFSEKVRVAFGIKGVAWSSVTIPVIMPKPDLMPLTGGYRKTPVMQIGADVWCDTQAILRELDRRVPEPSLLAGGDGSLGELLAYAIDRTLFSAVVAAIFAHVGDKVPAAFREDRSKFSGREFDPAKMEAALPQALDQLRAWAARFEGALASGRPFLFGDAPNVADLALYHCVWFQHERLPPERRPFAGFARIEAWRERMRGFGHGTVTETTAAAALAAARALEPETEPAADSGDPSGRKPGDAVIVHADDTGRDPVAGTLVRAAADEIVIERSDPAVGRVHVHFPRAGFVVRAQ
jgi:glutathione S-transferase